VNGTLLIIMYVTGSVSYRKITFRLSQCRLCDHNPYEFINFTDGVTDRQTDAIAIRRYARTVTRSQAVARIADRTAKNCRGLVT